MWQATAQNISMAEGDFGIQLPITISGITFVESDSIRITIKDRVNGTTLLTKEYTNIQNGTINLEFTESESALFRVGAYAYSMDWYQSSSFMCNLIQIAEFRVVDKA